MPLEPMVEAYLRDVETDLDAARRLARPTPNRLAAFHLQQAAEKLVKAVRLSVRLPATVEHDIATLVNGLPDHEPLRPLLEPLDDLTPYATSYRYPSVRGQLPSALAAEEIESQADAIARLAIDVRATLSRRPRRN
jgi:HEPN domain-containing protein